MLSEEFDKKIQDAADHHHPAYDENAWKGMKRLLDKHLPEEKDDRRRILFFLLLFLLMGGGAWYFFGRPSVKTEKETVFTTQPVGNSKPGNNPVAEYNNEPGKPVDVVRQNNNATAPIAGGEKNENRDNNKPVPSIQGPVTSVSSSVDIEQKTKKQTGKTKPANTEGNADIAGTKKIVNNNPLLASPLKPGSDKNNKESKDVNPVAVQTQRNKITPAPAADDNAVNTTAADNKKPDELISAKASVDKKTEKEQVVKIDGSAPLTRKEKQVAKRKSSFFISVSAGPDVSFTGSDKLGRMKFLGGAGIGYTYKEKFTLRTGFYSARKIYTSSPGEYHAPPNFYTYYPNLQRIEADCKVYEIPFNFSYQFSRRSKQNFFATAGLSTYLMKRETYDYYYKYWAAGPTVHKEYSYKNENKHFFSVLNLGAGYQRNISKKISVSAEPYLKLPMKGVGYGKVKLNSGGILFNVSFRPFGAAEKK